MTNEQAIENDPKATEGLTFGEAIEALKAGKRVAREGWNGKGMWLVYVDDWEPVGETRQLIKRDRLPFIAMKTAQDDVVPWLASQTDVLADDWQIIEGAAQ